MNCMESSDTSTRWLPLWPRSSRVVRTPHIIIIATIATISTLLLIAIMREHLLWALTSLTGYSAASFPSSAAATVSPLDSDRSPLTFSEDGTFKISILEDLHFGEAEDLDWGPRQDDMTLKVMTTVLGVEKPQLAVLNGDLITGENTSLENATNYVDMIVKPLVHGGYKWASAYGNHDQGYNLSSKAMLEREQLYGSSSLTTSMISGDGVGVTNYYISVFGSSTDTVPELLLWFFDSQGGREFQRHDASGEEIPVPGVVHAKVVHWFSKTSKELKSNYGRSIPSLAFVHIPVSAMLAYQQTGLDEHREPGINDDNPIASQWPEDRSFVDALAATEGLLAVFSGHDHGNDFCHPHSPPSSPPSSTDSKTPFFCFGRHTGYGGYGHWMRGSRQVVFNRALFSHKNPNIETWVRLEDGSVSGHVFLNETYGEDVYPKVKNEQTTLPPPES